MTHALEGDVTLARDEPVAIAPIERLHKWVLCTPLVAQYLWLSLKHLSITLPTSANPNIETGGFVGESKATYFKQIPEEFRDWILPITSVAPGDDAEAIRSQANLAYPLIAKPDIGWCGYGVRRIADATDLKAYIDAFPRNATFLLQALAREPNEAGIQYLRWPGETHGHVIALTVRHLPHVIGDGVRDVCALIALDPRTALKEALYRSILGDAALRQIPARGEHVQLTTIASARVGSRYEDAGRFVTPALTNIVDRIARAMPDFHFGRFDVRFESVEALQQGRFSIIEVNGAGSEAIQFWDPGLTLVDAYRGVFAKQRQLFALGAAMRRRGHKPITLAHLIRAHLHQQRLIRGYPKSN